MGKLVKPKANLPIEGSLFIPFSEDVSNIELPKKFTFPLYYEPHLIAVKAATELQEYLKVQRDFEHNFGLNPQQKGLVIGKMFGVLVVRNSEQKLGYLAAFSGKLAGVNHLPNFVPPVFDILADDGFFRTGEDVISSINSRIELLEKEQPWKQTEQDFHWFKKIAERYLSYLKREIKRNKQTRKQQRIEQQLLMSSEDYSVLEEEFRKQSLKEQYYLKDRTQFWKNRLENLENAVAEAKSELIKLKEERKEKSAALQQVIFNHYVFLNAKKELKNLRQLFEKTADINPPAGAGECAAPKLLHYAYLNDFEPIALAEFWWGQAPASEIRKHLHYYPACKGKCEPILAHMLQGLKVDENPMLTNPALGKHLEVVFEDEWLAIVNKPAEFLSVPGKTIADSVYERMKLAYPNATGPLIVHRLDMSTSGLMVIAKDKKVHQKLQLQFINRTVKKRYVALLEGIVEENEGIIDLPLRLDIEDRPRQLVCFDHGKTAQTEWKVVRRFADRTKIQFYPITGRTHQLRVHAAHQLGLGCPIVGDDLYGTKAERLHLHAEWLEFRHPKTKETMTFEVGTSF